MTTRPTSGVGVLAEEFRDDPTRATGLLFPTGGLQFSPQLEEVRQARNRSGPLGGVLEAFAQGPSALLGGAQSLVDWSVLGDAMDLLGAITGRDPRIEDMRLGVADRLMGLLPFASAAGIGVGFSANRLRRARAAYRARHGVDIGPDVLGAVVRDGLIGSVDVTDGTLRRGPDGLWETERVGVTHRVMPDGTTQPITDLGRRPLDTERSGERAVPSVQGFSDVEVGGYPFHHSPYEVVLAPDPVTMYENLRRTTRSLDQGQALPGIDQRQAQVSAAILDRIGQELVDTVPEYFAAERTARDQPLTFEEERLSAAARVMGIIEAMHSRRLFGTGWDEFHELYRAFLNGELTDLDLVPGSRARAFIDQVADLGAATIGLHSDLDLPVRHRWQSVHRDPDTGDLRVTQVIDASEYPPGSPGFVGTYGESLIPIMVRNLFALLGDGWEIIQARNEEWLRRAAHLSGAERRALAGTSTMVSEAQLSEVRRSLSWYHQVERVIRGMMGGRTYREAQSMATTQASQYLRWAQIANAYAQGSNNAEWPVNRLFGEQFARYGEWVAQGVRSGELDRDEAFALLREHYMVGEDATGRQQFMSAKAVDPDGQIVKNPDLPDMATITERVGEAPKGEGEAGAAVARVGKEALAGMLDMWMDAEHPLQHRDHPNSIVENASWFTDDSGAAHFAGVTSVTVGGEALSRVPDTHPIKRAVLAAGLEVPRSGRASRTGVFIDVPDDAVDFNDPRIRVTQVQWGATTQASLRPPVRFKLVTKEIGQWTSPAGETHPRELRYYFVDGDLTDEDLTNWSLIDELYSTSDFGQRVEIDGMEYTLQGLEPAAGVTGEKLRNFFVSIVDPDNPNAFTVDRHIAWAMLGGTIGPDTGKHPATSQRGFQIMKRAGILAAQLAGFDGSTPGLTPSAFQALVWEVWRKSFTYRKGVPAGVVFDPTILDLYRNRMSDPARRAILADIDVDGTYEPAPLQGTGQTKNVDGVELPVVRTADGARLGQGDFIVSSGNAGSGPHRIYATDDPEVSDHLRGLTPVRDNPVAVTDQGEVLYPWIPVQPSVVSKVYEDGAVPGAGTAWLDEVGSNGSLFDGQRTPDQLPFLDPYRRGDRVLKIATRGGRFLGEFLSEIERRKGLGGAEARRWAGVEFEVDPIGHDGISSAIRTVDPARLDQTLARAEESLAVAGVDYDHNDLVRAVFLMMDVKEGNGYALVRSADGSLFIWNRKAKAPAMAAPGANIEAGTLEAGSSAEVEATRKLQELVPHLIGDESLGSFTWEPVNPWLDEQWGRQGFIARVSERKTNIYLTIRDSEAMKAVRELLYADASDESLPLSVRGLADSLRGERWAEGLDRLRVYHLFGEQTLDHVLYGSVADRVDWPEMVPMLESYVTEQGTGRMATHIRRIGDERVQRPNEQVVLVPSDPDSPGDGGFQAFIDRQPFIEKPLAFDSDVTGGVTWGTHLEVRPTANEFFARTYSEETGVDVVGARVRPARTSQHPLDVWVEMELESGKARKVRPKTFALLVPGDPSGGPAPTPPLLVFDHDRVAEYFRTAHPEATGTVVTGELEYMKRHGAPHAADVAPVDRVALYRAKQILERAGADTAFLKNMRVA